MYEWHSISSQADIDRLRKYFNNFHDAYIKSVSYEGDIITNGEFTTVGAFNGFNLHIVLLVTSIKERPVVELRFFGVNTYHFGVPYADMIDTYFEVYDGGVIWANEGSFDPNNIVPCQLKNNNSALSYVAAKKLDWRLVDLPGTRLKRCGSEEGYWYVVPNVNMPMNDSLDVFADIIQNIADSGRKILAVRKLLRYSEMASDELIRDDYKNYKTGVLHIDDELRALLGDNFPVSYEKFSEAMTIWYNRLIDSAFPPDNLRFVTDSIISFNKEETRGKHKYEWYEVDSRDRLKQVMQISQQFYIAVSEGVSDSDKLLYTIEHMEHNGFYLAIRSVRGYCDFNLKKFYDCIESTGYQILPYTEEIYDLL